MLFDDHLQFGDSREHNVQSELLTVEELCDLLKVTRLSAVRHALHPDGPAGDQDRPSAAIPPLGCRGVDRGPAGRLTGCPEGSVHGVTGAVFVFGP